MTESKIHMAYYKETSPWSLKGERVKVVENNDHLCRIVSGMAEEQNNVDENIVKC